jgi:hypothetical protein
MTFIFPFKDFILDFLPLHLVILILIFIVAFISFVMLMMSDYNSFTKGIFIIMSLIVIEVISFSRYDSRVLKRDYNVNFNDLYIIKNYDRYYIYQKEKTSSINKETFEMLRAKGLILIDIDSKKVLK